MKELKDNLTLMTDFYELTMANGYLNSDKAEQIVYFDVFYRTNPDNGGFSIFAGLDSVVKYIQNLKFTSEDIKYLKSLKIFSEKFLKYLETFKFTGDVYSVTEGTIIFPNEPVMTIRGKIIEVQFLETFVLNAINFQSLIATKANRIVRAANGKAISEFGARRAHSPLGATLGARSAIIGGCQSTSNTLTGILYDAKVSGTMAHSWVQLFDSEFLAFKAYCECYPDNVVLLIDTYDTLNEGIYNAIKAFDEVLKPLNKRPIGVRIDSGDIAYLSKKLRKILDGSGYKDCLIVASNSLDEFIIESLERQKAPINLYGVGERLITSKSSPIFDGVYKLVAVEKNGKIIPKIKISDTSQKTTTPHFKKLYRLYDSESQKALADLICVHDETFDNKEPLELFDPVDTWKRKVFTNFTIRELFVPIFKQGKLVYKLPNILDIQKYAKTEIERLWDEVKRFENPHSYYVDLSEKLYKIKEELLNKKGKR